MVRNHTYHICLGYNFCIEIHLTFLVVIRFARRSKSWDGDWQNSSAKVKIGFRNYAMAYAYITNFNKIYFKGINHSNSIITKLMNEIRIIHSFSQSWNFLIAEVVTFHWQNTCKYVHSIDNTAVVTFFQFVPSLIVTWANLRSYNNISVAHKCTLYERRTK